MTKRYSLILNILSKKKKASITELSKELRVSEVTVRKDLSQLEDKGFLRREHGFATVVDSDDIMNRLSFNYEIKRKIAQKAVESIQDGETVMIESGSTCALLAEEIVSKRKDITIITNSVFIATFVRQKSGAHLILLGGEYQNEAQVMVGPLIKICAANFNVDKFFVGTDGFNEVGAMSGDLMRAEAVREMAKSSQHLIVLTESKKFTQTGVVTLLPFEKISAIYTDGQIEVSNIQKLKEKNIMVFTV